MNPIYHIPNCKKYIDLEKIVFIHSLDIDHFPFYIRMDCQLLENPVTIQYSSNIAANADYLKLVNAWQDWKEFKQK